MVYRLLSLRRSVVNSRNQVALVFVIFIAGFAGAPACGGSKGTGARNDADVPLGGVVDAGAGGIHDLGGGIAGAAGMTGAGGGISTGGGTASACGDPGAACCAGNSCVGGGCCVSGICLVAGGVCVGLGGDQCSNGACGACGGPGLPCCTSTAGLVCTSPGTVCRGGTCAKCGDQGTGCCTTVAGEGACNSADLMCGNGLCQKCGITGGPCCADNTCQSGCCYGGTCIGEATSCGLGNGACSAGRCTGCGSAAQPCCGNLCYDQLLCLGNACISCGGPGEACCPAGTSPQCQAGSACTGAGAAALCARCGTLGDICCPGNTCSDGCCSATGRCAAGSCPVSTGGSTGTGGASGTGGIIATGGTVTTSSTGVTGGTVITGGTIASGGVGGTTKTGGTTTTGGVGGGTTAKGGTTATGGTTGGTSATGGTSTLGSNASPGCGSANTTSPCSKSGSVCRIDIDGTNRTYYVQLPASYSSSKPYPVVFQYHPFAGSAETALTLYGINKFLPDAIYVTPQGLETDGTAQWTNTNGQDTNFTKAMLADIESKYCVDTARIFATGFSEGAMMTYDLVCELSDVFRAFAPISGMLMSDTASKCATGHPIAMWGSHGLTDVTIPLAKGHIARDAILARNKCGTTTTAVDPSPCVKYQGCLAGYDVTWCEWNGGHEIPSFAASAIGNFFKQL